MSKNKFDYSEEQKRALKDYEKNVIVSAQAGAGKTRVLVEKVTRLIMGKTDESKADFNKRVSVNDLLMVTFTNKAANEMKDRIKKSISEEIEEVDKNFARDKYLNCNKNEYMKYLTEQLTLVEDADISTIHAFCIKIIRQYFHYLDLQADFSLINSQMKTIKQEDAMDRAFEISYKDDDFKDLVKMYGSIRGDSEVKKIIFSVAAMMESQSSKTWLREVVSRADSQERKEWISKYIWTNNKHLIESSLDKLISAMAISKEEAGPFPYLKNLEEDYKNISLLHDALEKKEYAKLTGYLPVKFASLSRITKKDEVDPDKKDLVKKLRDDVKSNMVLLRVPNFEDLLYEKKVLQKIEIATELYLDEYRKLKKELNVIDFSDCEHLMLDLLENDQIVEEIKNKYKYIFFDEYQDANKVQNKIIDTISKSNNVFFVGDIKQSIYSFRRAEPKLFLDRVEEYKSGESGVKLDFTNNYRTRPEILTFINMIFDSLMTKEFGKIDYKDKSNRLVNGRNFNENKDSDKIEFLFVNKTKKGSKSNPIDEETEGKLADLKEYKKKNPDFNFQIKLIADKIEDEVKRGIANYGDYAILSRRSKYFNIFESYFKSRSIPLYTDDSSIDFDDSNVRKFIDILKVIDNDKDDLSLVSAMLSSMGKFSDSDLANIRVNTESQTFYSACREFYNKYKKDAVNSKFVESLDAKELDEIYEKLSNFYAQIDLFRSEVNYMGLEEFAFFVFKESGYKEYVTSLPDSKEVIDSLYAFMDLMKNYDNQSSGNLYGFLRYVNLLLESKKSDFDAISSSNAGNSVRLMTMHKSKGLQFKRVFIFNADSNFYLPEGKSNILEDDKLGLGLKLVDLDLPVKKNSISFDCILDSMKKEKLEEEARILYVALTRAIDKLYLVSEIDEDFYQNFSKSLDVDALLKGKSYMDWISNIFMNENGSFNTKELFNNENAEDIKVNTIDELSLKASFFRDYSLMEKNRNSKFSLDETDLHLTDEEEKILSWKYPYETDINLPVKMTVSKISEKNRLLDEYKKNENLEGKGLLSNASLDIAREKLDYKFSKKSRKSPKFMEAKHKFKADEVGTIIHFVFQNVSIKSHDKNSILEELAYMEDVFLISKEERACIDEDVITSIVYFFNSDIGKDIIKNKDNVRREEYFTMKYEDIINGHLKTIMVDGQIDLFYGKEELTIIDFKTNRRVDEALYEKQLSLYKRALEEATGKKVKKCLLYWTKHKKFTEM